jgi:hypothetical protein
MMPNPDDEEPPHSDNVLPSGRDLIGVVLGGKVSDPTFYDQALVALIHQHLGGAPVHSRAGHNLAAAIEKLAARRAQEAK